jgi:hypothetical protein
MLKIFAQSAKFFPIWSHWLLMKDWLSLKEFRLWDRPNVCRWNICRRNVSQRIDAAPTLGANLYRYRGYGQSATQVSGDFHPKRLLLIRYWSIHLEATISGRDISVEDKPVDPLVFVAKQKTGYSPFSGPKTISLRVVYTKRCPKRFLPVHLFKKIFFFLCDQTWPDNCIFLCVNDPLILVLRWTNWLTLGDCLQSVRCLCL